jgi:hypothetical protein
MPQRSSVEMLRGARRAQDYAYPKLKAIVDGNKAILAAVEEAIGFAGTHVKTMHRSDGAIVFDDPNDTAAFNAIVQRAN